LIGGIELANFDKLFLITTFLCRKNNLVRVEDLLEKYFILYSKTYKNDNNLLLIRTVKFKKLYLSAG
jgi:hypothetical protein